MMTKRDSILRGSCFCEKTSAVPRFEEPLFSLLYRCSPLYCPHTAGRSSPIPISFPENCRRFVKNRKTQQKKSKHGNGTTQQNLP